MAIVKAVDDEQPKEVIEHPAPVPAGHSAGHTTQIGNTIISISPQIIAVWKAEIHKADEVRHCLERFGVTLLSTRHGFEKLLQWDRVWDGLYRYVDDRRSDSIESPIQL